MWLSWAGSSHREPFGGILKGADDAHGPGAGTDSPWISRLLKQLGHQVIVANTRRFAPSPPANRRTTGRSEAGPLRLMCSAPVVPDSPSQPRAATGPQPASRSLHLGAGPDHARQRAARADQKRRRTPADLHAAGVCGARRSLDSPSPGPGGTATAQPDRCAQQASAR